MNEATLTRLCVGEPITLALGVPVAQTENVSDVSKTLRWKNGRWENAPSLLDRISRLREGSESVLKVPTQGKSRTLKIKFLVGAVVAVLAVASAGLGSAWYFKNKMIPKEPPLPIAGTVQGPATGSSVVSINEPYPLPSDKPQAVESKEVPGVIPRVDAPEEGVAQTPTAIAPAPVAPPNAVVPVVPRPTKDKAPVAAAVVMDTDVAPPAKSSPKDAPSVPVTQGKPVPVVSASKQPTETVSSSVSAAPVALKSGSGLVALTPDGKFALFTNTATRLPEKFGIGDKLPNGETIKNIDRAGGKVQTESKEYRLE